MKKFISKHKEILIALIIIVIVVSIQIIKSTSNINNTDMKLATEKIANYENEQQNMKNVAVNSSITPYIQENNSIYNNNSMSENIIYADSYNISDFNDYLGSSTTYSKAVELLNKFINEYYIYLSNSESNGLGTGIYVYLSQDTTASTMLKNAIVDSIESYLISEEREVEGTYNISIGNNPKYGQHIYVFRNASKMLRGTFELNSPIDNNKNNYDYIENFEEILNSKYFIEKIYNKYGIDLKNKIKIWSLTTNNFLMNIDCEQIYEQKYQEYSNYIFDTFKDMIDNTYTMELLRTSNFSEITQ